MSRMFRMAVRNRWIYREPAAFSDRVDAGGDDSARDRWLPLEELQQLTTTMRTTPDCGRENDLSRGLAGIRRAVMLARDWLVGSGSHVARPPGCALVNDPAARAP
jgi:hypothetical protein